MYAILCVSVILQALRKYLLRKLNILLLWWIAANIFIAYCEPTRANISTNKLTLVAYFLCSFCYANIKNAHRKVWNGRTGRKSSKWSKINGTKIQAQRQSTWNQLKSHKIPWFQLIVAWIKNFSSTNDLKDFIGSNASSNLSQVARRFDSSAKPLPWLVIFRTLCATYTGTHANVKLGPKMFRGDVCMNEWWHPPWRQVINDAPEIIYLKRHTNYRHTHIHKIPLSPALDPSSIEQ